MSQMDAAVVIPALHMPSSNQQPIAQLETEAKPTASSRSSRRAANFSPGAMERHPEHPTPSTLILASPLSARATPATMYPAHAQHCGFLAREGPPECRMPASLGLTRQ
ncbi:hypothetical protein HBI56_185170 [Parastagonospora nodorum]|uniref:Uncharacterized protein n=2 Tax=Phaeosphaeria nodorum (strain SN15 / ATCC MYA-4574 / FGSC 10173) TaxID=321614 RepID=A0A7U2FEU2_PHANO|nr:hypothetical protein SNOG_14283 [Parastagonospora nodorum SN15]KAH3907355.1 hypothetical protein HBH56_193630 [Parastagonospora nodorum]EAT78520.1 hypothetical protein SNOG_14283 [Parastagonospora nodorum SN15]KAH3938214.1 hypothetical protein HBH54_008330 [Parastagonospora nodorum]KAH3938777.1 hypothetical protein HBH53_246050 [Parastagonospora nodorum]KAH3966453.1 hypothetical protein HBH52_197290 [Parastagonospora nodorum]